MILKTCKMQTKQVCFFGHYQQNHSWLRGEKCTGGKISKERLTVLLCGDMVGEMEKSLVIGKTASQDVSRILFDFDFDFDIGLPYPISPQRGRPT
jgi:hypothetical protein